MVMGVLFHHRDLPRPAARVASAALQNCGRGGYNVNWHCQVGAIEVRTSYGVGYQAVSSAA
jgi:hypothetical protein